MPKDDSQGTTASNYQINGFSAALKLITANYTVGIADYSILVNASGGSVTVTLPALSAAYQGKMYRIMRTDATLLTSVNIVSQAGIKTINTLANISLTQYNTGLFVFDGSNWWRFS